MIVLSPLLFVIFTFLVKIKNNLYETSLQEVGVLLFFFSGITIFVQILLYFFTKDKYKASLVGTLFTAMVLNFGSLFSYKVVKAIDQYHILGVSFGRYRYIFPAYWTLFLGISFFILRFCSAKKAARFINTILLFFVFLNIVLFIPDLYSFYNIKKTAQNVESKFNREPCLQNESQPNIYYIMLDGYPRHDTLKSLFDFDNTPFLEDLKKLNFFVGYQSCSNYPATNLSLPSVLDMNYLDETCVNFKNMFDECKLFTYLKNKKYKIVSISSNFGFTAKNGSLLDEVWGDRVLQSFAKHLFSCSAFYPFMNNISFFQKSAHIKSQFKMLKRVSDNCSGSVFVFCHIIFPHLSFAFNKDGSAHITRKPDRLYSLKDDQDKEEFINQINVLNKLVLMSVIHIKNSSKKPPVIVIQSDHGSAWVSRSYKNKTFNSPLLEDMLIKERFSNLNALYLPNNMDNKIYRDITNVNVFRIILNNVFKESFDLLSNKCYWWGMEAGEALRVYSSDDVNAIKYPLHNMLKKYFLD